VAWQGGRFVRGVQHAMRGPKDAALAFALRKVINTRLGAIGEVTGLALDTADRRARLRVALRGEPDEIDVEVREFVLDRSDGADWISLTDVRASREWVDAALRQFAVGRSFRLSPRAAAAIRLLA
jgi:hypothetical protein